MALTTTFADLASWYERNYTPKKLTSLALKDAPTTAWVPKKPNTGGDVMVTRLFDNEAGGVGATLAQAIASERDPGAKQVLQSMKKIYTSHSIDNDSLESAVNNSVFEGLQMMINSTMRNHGDQLETALWWGATTAKIGKVATGGISGNVVTLDSATADADIWNFEVGDINLFDDTETGASPRTGEAVVLKVNRTAYTVEYVDLSTVTGEAAGDFIFKKSFEGGSNHPLGIPAWVPDTDPGGSDAFGSGSLNRSVNPERLAGWRYTATAGQSITSAIIQGITRNTQHGGRMESAFINNVTLAQFLEEREGKFEPDTMKDKELGLDFDTVKLRGPKGNIQLISAPKCPPNRIWCLTRDTWKVKHVGSELVFNPLKNNKVIDSESEDGLRWRWKSRYSIECIMPGHNGVIKLA